MRTHCTLGKAGPDGILHLDLAVGDPNAEFEVVVVLQPRVPAEAKGASENLGWPPGFFEETAGSIHDPTFRRHDQGEFERRAEF